MFFLTYTQEILRCGRPSNRCSYLWGVSRVFDSHSFTQSLSLLHTHTHTTGQCRKDTMKPRFKTWMAFRPFHGQKYHYSNLECLQLPLQIKYRSGHCTDVLFLIIWRSELWRVSTGRPTCVWAHLVQQLHHALPLHGRPAFDRGASPDLTVLLLDFWRPPFGNERPKFTVETHKENCEVKTRHVMTVYF